MKIERAIDLLQLDLDEPGSVPVEDLNEAQALGIEALKRRQHYRFSAIKYIVEPLPGEDQRNEH